MLRGQDDDGAVRTILRLNCLPVRHGRGLVAPTVVALWAKAAGVVDELAGWRATGADDLSGHAR
jgi:hypothetical protein